MKRKAANFNNLRWIMHYKLPVSQFSCVLLLLGLCGAVITATVFACGWEVGSEHSVRFNPYRTEKEFGRLPHLERYWYARANHFSTLVSSGWGEMIDLEWDLEEREQKKIVKTIDDLWKKAEEEEQSGDLFALRSTLREYLSQTSAEQISRDSIPLDFQANRNSVFDKLDALRALDQGSPVSTVSLYLKTRNDYDSEKINKDKNSTVMVFSGMNKSFDLKKETPKEVVNEEKSFEERNVEALKVLRTDRNLRDNIAYLEAARIYRDNNEKGIEAFAKVAASYPNSEKRESALFMYAVLLMKGSNAWTEENNLHPCQDCRDKYLQKACEAFTRVMREYPQGRYYADAQGWLAHLAFKVGDRVHALINYYQMLGSQNEAARVEALYSLNFVRNHATNEEMQRVEEALADKTDAALAYAYHNIYNYATFHVYDWDDSEEQKKAKKNREYVRIVDFATRMMKRYPKAISGAFAARVAEATFELERYPEAASLARDALHIGVKGESRAEALWIAGFSDYHLKRYKTARESFLTLIAENPNNRYTEGARRNLAMIEEDMGNLEAALEQYLALGYRYDATYFMEVLMKTEQLAAFIEKRPNLQERDELLYALGLRYLRDFRWEDAKRAFASIRPTSRYVDINYLSGTEYSTYNYEEKIPVKLKIFDPEIRGIRPQWIEHDIRTANELQRLENDYNAATDEEKKAEALYQLASYIYQSDLLFYNPVWRNNRHYILDELFQDSRFRQPDESRLLFESMQKNDMASRALEIYLDLVKKYPNTKAARDSLFTAAVCHERLREYNNYWRDIYADGGHAGERMVTYADVKRTYPDYKFPLGTFGWEPMTRTVNGGPGWAVPPKPKPRPPQPTFRQRAFAKLKGVAKSTLKMMRKSLRRSMKMTMRFWRYTWAYFLAFLHCLWVGLSFSTLCVVFNRARQARQRLREEFAQCAPLKKELNIAIAEAGNEQNSVNVLPGQKGILAFALKYGLIRPYAAESDLPSLSLTGEPGLFKARFGNFLRDDPRDKWLAQLREFLFKANQLRGDANGRSALILTLATHSLCFFLLVNLLLSL
jgi:TolA-binding protein